ncbi:hypothetical protein LEM8419_00763 [Neolewinella maritima]|uniref:TonB C-terminal domain-containing protein n=1 Tax=Neolewinella maritima TaxID=1383882 RepID=A0ABN8F2X2_9BACT|nr:energy transducer TonB [Neolewinella maritima]CAH0999463.1 hypothetical protein LEM8419_00763 [Neolewinella maritima]
MRTITLTLLLLLCLSALPAQSRVAAVGAAPSVPPPIANPAIREAAVINRPVPAFPGGRAGFVSFLRQHLDYPAVAQEYAVEGTVIVTVEVQTDGAVHVLGVAEPVFAPLDTAALRAARKLPRFLPAVTEGQPVVRRLRIPFQFSLR